MGEHDSKSTAPTHTTGTRKGEDIMGADGKEAGRHDTETTHADRPSGESTARDSTAINPESMESTDPDAPNLPPA
jgi:hypothetical protein